MKVWESAAAYGATIRQMTVDEYYLAADAGVFDANERLELIHGEVVELSPQKSAHAFITHNCTELLRAIFPEASIRSQLPLRLDEINEPEPDIVVAKSPASRYRSAHPGPDDSLLVIEVSDTTLTKDRSLKATLYAQFGIPEYWILDLQKMRLEVHREPKNGAYSTTEVLGREGNVTPLLGTKSIAVAELLPE